MLVPYVTSDSSGHYRDYYAQQKGNGLSVYRGATIQRGHGIGGFFSSLLKGAMPLALNGLKAVGRQAVRSGWNIAKDAISGRDASQSARNNLKSGGDKLVGRLVHSMSNSPRSKASGTGASRPTRKRRRVKRKASPRTQKGSGTVRKRKRVDQHKSRSKRGCTDICSGILVE